MALKLTDIDDYFEKEEPVEEVKQPEQQNNGKLPDNDDIDDDVYITPASKKRKRRLKIIFWGLLLVAIIIDVVQGLFWGKVAAEGKVRCYVVSLEKRGTVFESYEVVAIEEGTLDERRFSTRSTEIGKRIYNALGTDSLFAIEYTRYRTSLPWRGETPFVISDAQTAPAHPLAKPNSGENSKSNDKPKKKNK